MDKKKFDWFSIDQSKKKHKQQTIEPRYVYLTDVHVSWNRQKKMLWPFTTREYYYYTKPNQKKNTKNLSCITCFFSKFSKTVVVVINVVVVVVVNWSIDSMRLRVYMSIRKKNWWTWTKIYFVHVPVVVIFIIIINIINIIIINVVSLSWTVWSLFLMQ